MNHYKVVAVDIDGTLIDHDKNLTPPTKQAIEMIKEKGILFGIATGRPVHAVSNMLRSFGIYEQVDFLVCSNGVQILDLKTNDMTTTHQLTKEDVLKITDFMKPTGINYCVYDKENVYTSTINSIIEGISQFNLLTPKVVDPKDLPIITTNKVTFTTYPDEVEKLLRHMQYFDDPRFRAFFTQADLFEFVDARISKAAGIRSYLQNKNISMDDVVTFGDADNDKEMIEEAGLGIAMENATESVRAIADAITKSNQEDGVAYYLYKLFAQG